MHVVAIHGWQEESAELVQSIAGALGITAYEARQRMAGGGPTVVASHADPDQARSLAGKLNEAGVATLVLDVAAVRNRADLFSVRRFELGEGSLSLEAGNGERTEIAYCEINLLLPAIGITKTMDTKTITERKFSLGRTLMAGGLPMKKKVTRQEEVMSEERDKVLYLYAGDRLPILFSQDGMTYDGLGAAMKFSRELNFAYLTGELRRLSPAAVYDERLLKLAMQAKLLGPALNPETNLALAVEILARSLLCLRKWGRA
jgi:hypothetical protein